MIDFLVTRLRRNPYPVYRLIRRTSPVLHDRLHDVWMLFDHDSVKRALTDHDAFSSRAAPPGGKPLDWMIFLDPPLHTRLRAIVMRTFTPRAVEGLEPRIREIARGLLDPVMERGEMDLTREFADPLPLLVIAELLGIPAASRPDLKRWTDAILGLGDAAAGGERAARARRRHAAAKEEMRTHLAGWLEERRAAPKNDLLTRLLQAEVEGARLDEEEILGFFELLLLAGSETTTNLISNAVVCFLEHPDQLARLRREPDLLPAAIEEVLRYRSPVQMVFRATRRDVRVHGKVIPAGKLVLPMVGSANRDPARFADAERFDITRAPTPHVGFGHGVHFCLGAALARMEARVALSELLERVESFEPGDGGGWEPRRALNVHGPSRLPVRFRAADGLRRGGG